MQVIAEGRDLLEQTASLADETRARVLLAVEDRELSVGELCQVLRLPQSTVSRHLKALRDSGWLRARREGTTHFYVVPDDLGPSRRRLWMLLRDDVAARVAASEDRLRRAEVLRQRRGRSTEFFRQSAGRWDELRAELFGGSLDAAVLLAWLDPDWVVGDLGCGTGRLSEAVAPFVAKVVAVDDSPEMLAAARDRLGARENVEIRQGELEGLPLEDDSLDAAALSLVLHHAVQPETVLREVARCLKPRGRLIIVDMQRHEREEYKQEMGHVWLGFAEQQLNRWLQASGFAQTRWCALPVDLDAKGPPLFVAAASQAMHVGSAAAPEPRATDAAPGAQAKPVAYEAERE